MLTPSDVEQKTFSTALRGYDLDEVDDFLDEMVSTLRDLNEQLEEARSGSVGGPEVTTAPAPDTEAAAPPPLPEVRPEIDESAIGRALVAAQTAADQLLEDAQSQANRIVESAKSEADSWSEERDAKRREAEAEMAKLANRVAAVRSELSRLADEVSGRLDDMDAVITVSSEGTIETDESEADDDGADDGGGDESPEDSDQGFTEDDASGSDHLDQILSGVATDLQMGSDDDVDEGQEPEGPE